MRLSQSGHVGGLGLHADWWSSPTVDSGTARSDNEDEEDEKGSSMSSSVAVNRQPSNGGC